jgi:hypothetical protein
MEGETLIVQGTGSELGSYRWGDYTSMSVDPVDDCTFWYVNEYLSSSGMQNWKTRIASFKFPSCTNVPPPVMLSPSSLAFGNQLAGTVSASQSVTLTNNQTTALDISGVSVSSNFAQTNNCGASVAASATCTIVVTFAPNSTGLFSGTVTISDDAGNSPQVLSVSGTGIAPVASLSRAVLSFGAQAVGSTSSSKPVILTNSGSAPLSVTRVSISGSFSESDNCTGAVLQAKGNCTINVSFSPLLTGTVTGEVTITDAAASSPQLVGLSGMAVYPLSMSPASLSFGNVTVGTTTAAKTVTLSNNLPTALSLSMAATGNYSVAGSGSTPCGSTLAGTSKCSISVAFSPTSNGTIKGAVTLSYNGSLSPQVILLSGVGVNGTIAAPLTFSPSSVNFNNVVAGTTSTARAVKVTNSGTVPITISSISAGADFAASSSGTMPCGGLLAVAASCAFSVTFIPIAPGSTAGSVTIADDFAVSPQILNLSGTAILPVTLSPTSLSFTTQAVGNTSPSQTIAVTNNQTKSLTINSVAASGDYLITTAGTNPCGSSIPALGTCNIGVAFTPNIAGTINGAVTINHNAAFSPQVVSLTGTAQ